MSKARKLQQEVESTLKKVNEGVDEWQKLWDKLDQTEDQRDRQKLIDALKNSLKKLKRMRESVRGWLASGEVKDENPLHEARKAIEKNMECFKALEKDLKTKAFSKEGLMRDSTDPAMMARVRCADWLNDAASRLETQADGMEADLEAMQVASASVSGGGKKGRGAAAGAAAMAAERMEHLNAMIERHRDYQAKIDQTLRLLENEQVTPDEVENALKDGLEYFIEAYAEDDFIEDEELWEPLPLSEVDEAVGRLRPHEIHAAKGGPLAEGGEEEGVGGGGGGGGGAIGAEPSEASAMTSVPAQQEEDDATSMNMKPQQDAAALLKSKGSKIKTAKPTAIPPPTKTDSGEAVSSASVSLQPPPGVVVAKPPVPLTPSGVQTSPTAYRGAAPTPPSGLGQQQQQQTGGVGTAPAPAPPAATTTAAAVAAAGHPHVVVSPRAQRPKVSVSSVATATPAVAWSARVAAGLSPAPETTPTSTSATSTPRALKTTTTAAAGAGGGGGGAAVGGPGVKQGQGEGRTPPPPPPPPPRPPSGGVASPRSPFAYAAAVAVGGGGGEAGGAGISDGVAAVPAAESQPRQQDGGLDGVPSVGKQTSLEALNGHTPFAQQSQQPFGSRSGSETVQGEAAAAAAADGEGSGAVADPLGALTWHLGTWVEHAEQSLVSRSRVPRVMSPWELALLEASVGNRPQSTDAEWRCTDGTMAGFDERWQPPHPVVTPASYPTRIHPSLMQQSTFNKLSPETQFAAFYFTQNPRQQGFAINALKKAGWRYHTELHHWFSRTGPTDIQPTHERGTLMYWQPNIGPVGGIGSPRTGGGAGASGGEGIGGWRAAKTGPDFVFDYRYMENSELQVPSA